MNASNRFKDFESALENQKQTHSRANIFLALSRLFERSFYYGVRATIVLYATGEILQMDNSKAISIYSILAMGIIVSQLLGGLLGDLLIGYKKMSFIGGLLQVVGSLFLIIPAEIAFYIGVGMIALGTGIYSSNFMAVFAKSYFGKLRLLDSGFTLVYGLINIGSFIGVLFIGFISERIGYSVGFAITSGLMMISVLFLYLSKIEADKTLALPEIPLNSRVLTIAFAVIIFIGFWVVYNLTSADVRMIDNEFYQLMEGKLFNNYSMQVINPAVITLGSIGLFVLWTFYRIKSAFKMILGVLLGLLGLVIIYSIWPNLTRSEIYLFSVAIGVLGIAELLITPILFSIIGKYAKPKYLAISMASVVILARISFYIANQFKVETSINSVSYLNTGIIILACLLILSFLFIYLTKNRRIS